MAGTLVVQTAFLGDLVLTIPLLRELKRALPDAPLTLVTTALGASTLSGQRCVDALVVFDKNGKDRGALGLLRLGREIRFLAPDVIVAAQRSARTGLLALLSGASVRIGFEGAPGRLAYTRKVAWDPAAHAVRRYLALAAAAGGDPAGADPRPWLEVDPVAGDRAARLLLDAGIEPDKKVLAVAPGSVWGTKRWIPEGFAAVVAESARRGLAPVLVGSEAERKLCGTVAATANVPAANVAGRCGIPELAAVLARAVALVSNDSGSGHVASAVGTPVVAIFGPTATAFGYTPFGVENRIVEQAGLPCRPCDRHGPAVCPLGHFRCMREIGPERVLAALDEVLAARERRGDV